MKFIERWFPWLLLAPAVLPLIYIDGLLYPYVAPKTLLLRGLFIVAAAAFAYLVLSGRPFYFGRLRNWVVWIPGVLLGVAYTTSFLGLDFYHSFWSIFDRGDGLLTLTSAVGFFYLILLYADRQFLSRLFSFVAWVGSAIAVYTILQWLQEISGMNIPLITDPRGRLGATFGNAAFLAAYLGMTFFVTLAVLKEYSGRWRTILYVGATLQLLAAILTATRGTLLALLLAGVLTTVYFAWKGEGRMRTNARFGLAAVVILAALFFMFRGPLSEAPFEPIRRIASISIQDATVSSRFFVWQNVFDEAAKRPLTGYGAEHIDVLFNRVYDPGAIIEQWFDRSHNAYLDYFVQYGIFGALLYAALIAALILVGWRLHKRRERYGAFIVLIAFVYAVQNFFVFDTAMTLWLFLAIYAAALAYASAQASTPAAASPLRVSLPNIVPVGVGIVLLALLYPVGIQPLRANLALAEGYLYHIADIDRAVNAMEHGLSLNTYADLEYGYQAYSMYTDRQQNMLEGSERVVAYRYALDILTKNYERYAYDARTATYLAHVLDSAPPEEPADEEVLRSVLAKAIELSPKRAQAQYMLANISLKKGDKAGQVSERSRYYREGIEILAKYAAQVPNLAEPRYIIANLHLVINDRVSAKKWADEGSALYLGGEETARRAIRYYIAVEDWPHALSFMEGIVNGNPGDYETLYDSAKLHFLTGNRARALEIVEQLRRDAPGLVETDPAFLKSLGS